MITAASSGRDMGLQDVGMIDVHTHIVPENFPAYAGKHADAPWPSMASADCGHRHVMVKGSVYRTVTPQCWAEPVRRQDMERLKVVRQVLSPMPELLSYWMEPEDGAAICRFMNHTIAEMVASNPAAFIGLGAVPLQNVDDAIRELDVIMHQFGLAGVEIGGNINGAVIGNPAFAPFFEAAAEWGAAIFVHPLRPTGMDRLAGPPLLEQVLAFPGETGLAAASMITGGTLAGNPALRIAFSHGGGAFSSLLPRLQHAWNTFAPLRERVSMEPVKGARSMYYDSLVYDDTTLQHLINIFGDTQIMVGTDYPFSIMEPDPAGRVQSLVASDSAKALLRRANAERWLGLA
jgi:aminocarboxymuconate-semialdehyde decarboxylase